MFRRLRLHTALILAAASLGLTACVGVLNRCGDGLNPPAGGWDRHGPG
ncbi:hypothetical protein [Brevundimonas goettingensis]|uniref:Lipoprotein n=1 Tax=Brevundimonas goettingensis TaxID=2774190 RepID=A0A975GZU9_9CAUL|nr:hypothetical protein [Brevundimonas goettingensis]QTC93010.1 hypothetical protein IFJ75_09295 [Brevundimonas goettingensis]